jgi:DNA helicase II / ATP-dependent DNA helicase PcrA
MPNRVQPGTQAAEIIAEEERLHGRVQARVAVGEEESIERVGVDEFDRELLQLRDMIAEAKPEDLAPLVEQMTRLAAIRGRLGGSRSLPVDVQSPYFAHMALRDEGKRRDVLIGKRGFIDRKSNVQIVDWRNAPVSRIYYRYEEGDDYEEDIAGRRTTGVVDVRRNVSIAGGRLRRIGAPQGTFIRDARNVWHQAVGQAAPVLRGGQGKASRMPRPQPPARGKEHPGGRLGVHHGALHRADKSLPEIAALIDKEQFDLITQPESGMVVIQGGAGSGKTTVALHRIAYLNFADPGRFRPSAILFVVPSRSLVKYVSGVLPALGVQGVPVVTYERWAHNQRLQLLRGSSGTYNADTPDVVARVKKHPALLSVLEAYVAEQMEEAERALARALGEGGAPVMERWRSLAGRALVVRLGQLGKWVRKNEKSLPTAVNVAAESTLKRLRRRASDVLTDWAEILTDRQRLQAGFNARGASDVSEGDIARTVSWCAQQITITEAEPEPTEVEDAEGNAISAVDGRALDEDEPKGAFDVEDDPILLRLIQLKRGRLIGPDGHEVTYEHVAIDEAQDRSAIEVKVLVEATRAMKDDPTQRSVTIAGDTAQRLVFDNNFSGWQEMLASMGQTAVIRPLSLSYRSTAEVMQFAREILGPDLAPDEPLVARSGEPVELHEFGDIGEAVAFLADALRALAGREPTASVAVVARYAEQADAYYEGLARAEVPALRRIRSHEFSFAPGVDVTDVGQVKGLEFDYVILVEVTAASYPPTVESRHLLHIGATRAAHQLWLVSTSEPSPLLPEALRQGGLMMGPPPAEADGA